jgi:hypothetical protein
MWWGGGCGDGRGLGAIPAPEFLIGLRQEEQMAKNNESGRFLGISRNASKGQGRALNSGIEKRSLSPAGHLETLKPSAAVKQTPKAADPGAAKPADQSTGRKN